MGRDIPVQVCLGGKKHTCAGVPRKGRESQAHWRREVIEGSRVTLTSVLGSLSVVGRTPFCLGRNKPT